MAGNKKQLGQFFTTNSDYILKGLEKRVVGKEVIDPFAGNGDLLVWAKNNGAKNVRGFDIDKKYINKKTIKFNDNILSPLKFKFVITNPPYLNVNKATKETKFKYFSKFQFEDLYQIALQSIMDSDEGIVIVPINFLSAENSKSIRDIFFSKFEIVEINYFKQQVFADTTYNVIAFYYVKKTNYFKEGFEIKTHIYPEGKDILIKLERKYGWIIGGEFVSKIKNQDNNLGVYRLTEEMINNQKGDIKLKAAYNHIDQRVDIYVTKQLAELTKSNVMLLKAIDSGTDKGKIALENIKNYGVECLISKSTSRHMIYLVFSEPLPVTIQNKIINLFNKNLEQLRQDYCSLFLTNYRDKDRKRISFDFAYKLINHIYFNNIINKYENLNVLPLKLANE
ncbi:MAG: Eco57I restriction-modification methylase domain-containing protein [Candidatus Doudnabacteria bacterium]|nr:Eco57I restriction-modification methylase domain-containing protein [Candidatus Doudnabacteria bacterium]